GGHSGGSGPDRGIDAGCVPKTRSVWPDKSNSFLRARVAALACEPFLRAERLASETGYTGAEEGRDAARDLLRSGRRLRRRRGGRRDLDRGRAGLSVGAEELLVDLVSFGVFGFQLGFIPGDVFRRLAGFGDGEFEAVGVLVEFVAVAVDADGGIADR